MGFERWKDKQMKKRIGSMILAVVMLLVQSTLPENLSAGAVGTYDFSWYESNPAAAEFQLDSAAQLAAFSALVNGNYGLIDGSYTYNGYGSGSKISFVDRSVRLNAAVDLSAYDTWLPIGTGGAVFKGSFDGGDHPIRGMRITETTGNYIRFAGLFGYVAGGACVRNIQLSGMIEIIDESMGVSHIGGVVGYSDGTVLDCMFDGQITAKIVGYSTNVGGIVGSCNKGMVKNCASRGQVSALSKQKADEAAIASIGGVAGNHVAGEIYNCYHTGSVSRIDEAGQPSSVGGIVGRSAGKITNCYNAGVVSGEDMCAGIAGTVLIGAAIRSCFSRADMGLFSVKPVDMQLERIGTFEDESGVLTAKEGTELVDGLTLTEILQDWVYDRKDSTDRMWQAQLNQYPQFGGYYALSDFAVGDIAVTGYTGTYDGQPHTAGCIIPDRASIAYRTESEGEYTLLEAPKWKGTGNYTMYYKVTKKGYNPTEGQAQISISPRRIVMEGQSITREKTYDQTDAAQCQAGTPANVVAGDDVSVQASATYDNVQVGQNKTITMAYELSGDDAANYEKPADEVVTNGEITTKKLTIAKVTASDREYNGSDEVVVAIAIEGNMPGEEVSAGGTGRMQDADAGEHKPVSVSNITLSGRDAENYSIDDSADTTVTILPAEVEFTVGDESYPYDGMAHEASVSAKVKRTGEPFTGFIVTYNGASEPPVDAGSYEVKAELTDTNYTGILPEATLTIQAAEQSELVINGVPNGRISYRDTFTLHTAGGQGKGQVRYEVTEGLDAAQVNAETGQVTVTGVGKVRIKATKEGDGNYEQETAYVQFQAQKRVIGITISNLQFVYQGVRQEVKAETDDAEFDAGRLAFTYVSKTDSQKKEPISAGEYIVTAQVPEEEALFEGSVQAAMQIQRAPLVVTALDAKKRYIQPNPDITVDYRGFVGGDSKEDLGGTLSVVFENTDDSPVGVYDVTVSGLTSENYEITYQKGTLTIEPLVVLASVSTKNGVTVTLSEPIQGLTADNISIFLGGQTISPVQVTEKENGTEYWIHAAWRPGMYVIVITAPNYRIPKTTFQLKHKDEVPDDNESGDEWGGGGGGSTPTYRITAKAGKGGSVTPESASVIRYSDKTFEITAEDGFVIEDVLVDGESVGAKESYTFSNITRGHTIEARFKKDGQSGKPEEPEEPKGLPYYLGERGEKIWIGFSAELGGQMRYIAPEGKKILFSEHPVTFSDIQHWAKEDILFAAERELMLGMENGLFQPDEGMTRGMFAAVLARLYLADVSLVQTSGFIDVLPGAYYEKAVSWAAEKRIVQGVGEGKFAPDALITREELAIMFYSAAQVQGMDVSKRAAVGGFKDGAEVSSWAEDAISWAVGTGLLQGDEHQKLNPKAYATRAEMAVLLRRFIEYTLRA